MDSHIDEQDQMIENIKTLLSFCQQKSLNSFISNFIDFRGTDDKGVGIFTNAEIKEVGTILISIPFNLCFSIEMILNNRHLKALFSDNPGYLNYVDEVLAIGLLYAKTLSQEFVLDGSCDWYHHVNVMPLQLNSTLFWSEEELLELLPCNTYHLTRLMKKQIQSDFESLYVPLISQYPNILGKVTVELYAWALSIVYSRSIEITRNNQTERCIVPLLDMANHNPLIATHPSETFRYDDSSDSIQLLNSIPLLPNDECCAVYGIYPNSKLISTYGFVIMDNPIQAIDLWTKISPSSVNYAAKQSILDSNPLTNNQTYDFKGTIRDNYISPSLLATIRIIQANEEDMSLLDKAFIGEMISVRNESASYVSLKNLLIARMKVEKAEVL